MFKQFLNQIYWIKAIHLAISGQFVASRRSEESSGKPRLMPTGSGHTTRSFLEIMRRAFYERRLLPKPSNISSSRPSWRLCVFAAFVKGWPRVRASCCELSVSTNVRVINWAENCDRVSRVLIWSKSHFYVFFLFSDTPHVTPGSSPVSRLRI